MSFFIVLNHHYDQVKMKIFETDDPRNAGREAVKKSVSADLWEKNFAIRSTILETVRAHRIVSHPIINQLSSAEHDVSMQRFFHLEFRHAFAQIFTDALIRAMFTSSQLEPRLGAMGKVAARFLLQLNLLDELGFVSGEELASDYAGNPHYAHYVQFDSTLRQLGVSAADADAYIPSAAASACRATFESNYDDHVALTSVLAVSESVFTQFAGPWAKGVGAKTSIDVSGGYHSIHVEKDGQFIDDDHSEDAWFVFQQAITPDRHDEILSRVSEWLDTWSSFLDQLVTPGPNARSLAV
jgi:hypothetical protein